MNNQETIELAETEEGQDDLGRRAVADYYNNSDTFNWEYVTLADVRNADGEIYVVLHNHSSQLIAIYRVYDDLSLERLNKWPEGVEQAPYK